MGVRVCVCVHTYVCTYMYACCMHMYVSLHVSYCVYCTCTTIHFMYIRMYICIVFPLRSTHTVATVDLLVHFEILELSPNGE